MFARSKTLSKNEDWIRLDADTEICIASTIGSVDSKLWASLNGEGNILTSYRYLKAFEETAPAEIQCVYATLRYRGEITGAWIFQIVHLSPEALTFILQPLSSAGKIVGGLADWLTRCKEQKGMRVLISGNNFISGEHGVIVRERASLTRMFRLMPKVVQRIIDQFSEPAKISLVLVKDYYSKKRLRPERVLTGMRYHSFAVEPEMILDLQQGWNSYHDYELAMAKKYRNRSRTVHRKSAGLKVKNLNAEEIFAYRYEIFSLYMAVHANAKFRLAALTPDYFATMKREFPTEFSLSIYSLEGKIVAFRSGFRNRNEYEAHFIGVDYVLNRDLCLYQRILYDFVNDAILSKSQQLLLGRTAAEIKSTVGAVPHELVCFMRHRNALSNHIISPFVEYLKPEEWIQRNPFKSEPGSDH